MNKHAVITATGQIIEKIKGLKDKPLEEIIRAAMKEARVVEIKTFWDLFDLTDDERFRAAVTAIANVADDETRDRIKKELQYLGASAATKKNVRFDPRKLPKNFKPIDLLTYWKESKNGETPKT